MHLIKMCVCEVYGELMEDVCRASGIRLDISDLHSTGIAASRIHITHFTTVENRIETIKQELQ